MIYCVDIDNTLCLTKGNDYEQCVPLKDRIDRINTLYAAGHIIKVYTGRGSHSGRDCAELTRKQLGEWGLKYHELIMGKPHADCFIDDKALDWSRL